MRLVAERAAIGNGARVLDVGCGVGGSALWLASNLACRVHGVTISPVQARLARRLARRRRLCPSVEFTVSDAERLQLPPASFDVVWVIECSEHLADKKGFVARCAEALRPGGSLVLCAWLTDESVRARDESTLTEIRTAMLCPSIATRREYHAWIDGAGLRLRVCDDLTEHVRPTWDHCAALARRPDARLLAGLHGRASRRFVASFGLMREAMARGVLRYGLFVASRPESGET